MGANRIGTRYSLMGNTTRPIHSVHNLQRKFNKQHRWMTLLDIWQQVFVPRTENEAVG